MQCHIKCNLIVNNRIIKEKYNRKNSENIKMYDKKKWKQKKSAGDFYNH